ncbi:hypothetical protein F5Y10DRAFT_284490 [Nemania abortiva]|nr:hypothetical protein F5Y10DRAFT_284490 [Nemania abortiva]
MPRRLPNPHSCIHCEHLFLNIAPDPSSTDQKFEQWGEFVSSEAVNLLEETSALREFLYSQLRLVDVICTVSSRQIQEYAAGGCLFFSYVEEKTADRILDEPADQYKDSAGLVKSSGESASEDEPRFFICAEHTVPSEFRFRYLVHPHRVFVLVDFTRDASKFTSDDGVRIDPFQMMFDSSSSQTRHINADDPEEPSRIPSDISYDPLTYVTFGRIIHELTESIQEFNRSPAARARLRSGFVPTRLLTFSLSDVEPRVWVIEAHGLWQSDRILHLYAALSYCWGGKPKLQLSRGSKRALMEGIAFTSLPHDDDDKDREFAVMAKAYQNAFFTIVASRAASVEEGFLGPRLPFQDNCGTPFRFRVRYPPSSSHSRGEIGEAGSYFSAICFLKMDLITSGDEGLEPVDPTLTRAWCYQESALSQIVIEFGLLSTCIRRVPLELARFRVKNVLDGWYCHRTGDIAMHGFLRELAQTTDASVAEFWQKVVEYYSQLALSFQEDRLPALSALAEAFSPYFRGGCRNYLAGLWRDTLPQALLWAVAVKNPDTDGRPSPGTQTHAPMWSWASVTSPVNHALVPLILLPEGCFKSDLGVGIQGYDPNLSYLKLCLELYLEVTFGYGGG